MPFEFRLSHLIFFSFLFLARLSLCASTLPRFQAAILYNLKARHVAAKPYSRVADIIIAVNPYQWLTDLYAEKVRMHYAEKIVWSQDKNLDTA